VINNLGSISVSRAMCLLRGCELLVHSPMSHGRTTKPTPSQSQWELVWKPFGS
jgi:hypothetical protein